MPVATIPDDEQDRLQALRAYEELTVGHEQNFDTVAWLASKIAGTPIALVTLVDAEHQWFKGREGIVDATRTPRDHAFCSHALLDPNNPLVVEDARADPRFRDNPLVTGPRGFAFYAGVPLIAPSGHMLGTLCVIDRRPRTINDEVLDMLAALANSVIAFLELQRATRQIAELSMTDSLTGVLNRFAFIRTLEETLVDRDESAWPLGLVMLGVDRFRALNETLGMRGGDQILKTVGNVLKSLLGSGATIGRVGSNEFVILQPENDHTPVAALADLVRASVEHALRRDGLDVHVSAGAVTAQPSCIDAVSVLEAAAAALHIAATAGGSVLCRNLGGRLPEHVAP